MFSGQEKLTVTSWKLIGAGLLTLAGCFLSTTALAGDPEYLKADLTVGRAIEIKGYLNDGGIFVATDLEELPKPRKPKLRGRISQLDVSQRTVTLFGQEINVSAETEFVDEGGDRQLFEKLKVGQRVEISVKVDKAGNWLARRIRTRARKKSNKIKGTITKTFIDGKPPDSISISGLIILLNKRTDYDTPEDQSRLLEREVLGDLADSGVPDREAGGYLVGQNLWLTGKYRQDLRLLTDFDLSEKYQSDRDDSQQDIRLEVVGYLTPKLRAEATVRFRKRYLLSSEREQDSPQAEFHFTELFVLAQNFPVESMVLQVGRQDFDEPREWLFDEYLDAVRLYSFGPGSLVLEAALISSFHPAKEKFDTWTDYFARARWYLDLRNEVSAYVLSRTDSDSYRNREPTWWGLRYYGQVGEYLKPWADLAIMRGEDKGRSLDAWAYDWGGTLKVPELPGRPAVTFGYAVGSGDRQGDDDISEEFRQSAYQDNVDRFGGESSIHYYGIVLDPELSNLKVSTFSLAISPISNGSVELVYHGYRQHEPDNDLQGSDLVDPPARPNGASNDLGWAYDLVVAVPPLWERLKLSWTLGQFSPGEAFTPRQETAFLNKVNLSVNF